jgi:hypothetical protein
MIFRAGAVRQKFSTFSKRLPLQGFRIRIIV